MARTLTFRFDTVGDETTASSRLRAWKLGWFLSQAGHRVLMNEGTGCDVYVCQKVRPFASAAEFRQAGALVVYDFDDHFLLEGPEGHGFKDAVVAFINGADVVTVGSTHLLEAARNYHPNVFVLENPVDIDSSAIMRGETAELKRVGWFGTPAGLADLAAIKTAETVLTVTRRGDIEFDLKTIDATLAGFDLVLIPVETNEWNLAKNANRMAKAVALGVPVLVSATPEHVEAARLFGLDERFLVRGDDAWDEKIARLRADFDAVQRSVGEARLRALERFSLERVGIDWLGQVEHALAGEPVDAVPIDTELSGCALVAFSVQADAGDFAAQPIGEAKFGSRRDMTSCKHDFLKVFDDLWNAVAVIQQDWIVLLPSGWNLTRGFAVEIREALHKEPDRHLFLIRSQAQCAPPDEWGAYGLDLREAISCPRDPGVLVVRREWLLAQPLRPVETLSYWTWTLVVLALSQSALGVVSTPVIWRKHAPSIANICREYAMWSASHGRSADLPDADEQWSRLSSDVFSRLAELLPGPVASAFAVVAVRDAALFGGTAASMRLGQAIEKPALDKAQSKILRLESELRELHRSSSWRLTAPLRGFARSVSRIMDLFNASVRAK